MVMPREAQDWRRAASTYFVSFKLWSVFDCSAKRLVGLSRLANQVASAASQGTMDSPTQLDSVAGG
jgi:hypothetical protein